MRYNRQIVLPQFDLRGQELLDNARVTLIGVGGLGCSAAQALAYSGVGQITLVDDDIVTPTNLQRQVLFTDSDIGLPKVIAARQRLSQLDSGTQYHVIERRLNEAELIKEVATSQLILDCTDNLATRCQLVSAAYTTGVPLISAAAIRFEGQLFISDPSQDTACYGCALALFGEANESCVETGILAPVAMFIGNYQALLAIKKLSGLPVQETGKLQLFDAITQSWTSFTVTKSPSCHYCKAR